MTDFPTYEAVRAALHRYLLDIDSATVPSEAYWSLAEMFRLSPEQLALKRQDGRGSAWENRVQWARRKLVDEGIMDRSCRGIWCLNPYHTELARRHIER